MVCYGCSLPGRPLVTGRYPRCWLLRFSQPHPSSTLTRAYAHRLNISCFIVTRIVSILRNLPRRQIAYKQGQRTPNSCPPLSRYFFQVRQFRFSIRHTLFNHPALSDSPLFRTAPMSLLVNRPWLHDLWEEAQTEDEYATTALWENIFAEIFPFQQYNVASQQPPTKDPGDRRRIDLVVRPRNERRGNPRAVLLFMEAKRTGSPNEIVVECERQALTACWAYMMSRGLNRVWAMTCIGSRTRLWACQLRDDIDYLTPFFPTGTNLADINEYIEIAQRGIEVLHHLEYIKANPLPPKSVFSLDEHAVTAIDEPLQSQPSSGGYQSGQGFATTTEGYQSRDVQGGADIGVQSSPAYDVDANQCILVTAKRRKEVNGRQCYQYSGSDHEKDFYIPVDGWQTCRTLYGGQVYDVYTYISSSSGTQYLAWTLP